MNIDRETAEKVMGWEPCRDPNFPGTITYPTGTKVIFAHEWHPSTNIQHAMEVEAEMYERGYAIDISRKGDEIWMVFFFNSGYATEEKTAPTLPEAICLAALSAINE